MNIKAWIPLVVAIVLGLIAAMMAKNLTAPKAVATGPLAGTVDVVTAGRNIAPGEEVRPEDLVMKPITATDAPEGTFLSVTELTGRVAAVQMVKGQPVIESLLAPSGVTAGLSALVPEGMRAITIEVNEFSGLAGMVLPGSRVDVLSTLQGSGDEPLARTIVQNVKVTAVGQQVSTHQEKKDHGEPAPVSRSVTLLVTPEQAETIELAAVTSRPRLVLRGSQDVATTAAAGVSLTELRGGANAGAREPVTTSQMPGRTDPFETQPLVETAAPTTMPVRDPFSNPSRQVEIIRGGVVSQITVDFPPTEPVVTEIGLDAVDSK